MTRRRATAALATLLPTAERVGHAQHDAIVHEVAEATVSGQVIARRVRIRPAYECIRFDDNDDRQALMLAAARRFRDDYDTAVWRVHDTGREDGQRIRSNVPPTTMPDAVLDAMARHRARLTWLGPCAHVVIAVVGEDRSLSEVAEVERRNRQELAGVLKAGLEALVKLDERRG